MASEPRTNCHTNHIRWLPKNFCALAAVVLVLLCQGCQESQPRIVRPPLAELRTSKLELNNLKQVAPAAVIDTDPDMCPQPSSPDPHETSIGGLSSRAAYQFSSEPHLQNLYARLVYQTQLCTANSLSSKDRGRLQAVLNFLKITNARSFAATMSLTGNGQGGVKYPQVAPFSYSYDESASTYAVQTIGKGVIPWQATSSFDVQYSYNANTKLSINTTKLFSDIVTAIGGAGSTTSLLSPAANAYLSAGQTVLQSLAQSVFTQINTANDSYHFDMLQGPQGPDRSLTYRFRDLSSPPRPLAAVRFTVSFTNSIANPIPVDPTTDDTSHIPHFDQLQPILNVTVGGPSGGQTLLQQISKEQSYQDLLKSTADTTPQSFRSSCDQLESALQTTYGLNIYDTALAMGQVLSQNTLYLSMKKFYGSGCFQNRSVLKTMGITVFEQAPSS
jgi:hypothetical protein